MVSSPSDPHAELGVPPNATAAEIQRAFRRRLREHHPDTRTWQEDPSSDRALQRILDAYAILRRQPVRPAEQVSSPGATDAPVRAAPGPLQHPDGPPFRVTPVRWAPARNPAFRGVLGDPQNDDRLTVERLISWLVGTY